MNTKTTSQRAEKRKKYLSIYGLEILHIMLKNDGFLSCSFTKKSIPTPGSHTKNINSINPLPNAVNKVMIHKNLDVTLFCDAGVIRYSK